VTTFPRDARDAEGLMQSVDELLYRAKALGKNKIHHRAA
jgi:PleD family two-component response regulator